MQESLAETSKAQRDEVTNLVQKGIDDDKKTGVAARIGMFATTIALVLICIFAIHTILHVG